MCFSFLINLIKLQIIKDTQHIIDKKHGIIDIIIIIKGDISIIILSFSVQFEISLSSVIFIIFIYILLNGIYGYFLIRGWFVSFIRLGFVAII